MTPWAEMRPRAAMALLPVAAIAITGACYVSALGGGLIWDDRDLVSGAGRVSVFRIFSKPYLDWWGCYYRPLTTLSLAAQVAVSGADPMPLHCLNVIAHLVNVGLLYALGRRFGASASRAAVAAALWGVFPRLTEAVTWISGRTDVLATSCVLAALLIATGGSPRRRLAAAGLLFAGLLFKEVAIAGLPALAVLEVRRDAGDARGRGRRLLRRMAPTAAGAALFLLLRALVLPNQWFADGMSGLRRPAVALHSAGMFTLMLLQPLNPSVFIGDIRFPSMPLEVLGAAMVIAVVAAVRLRSARWKAGTLAMTVLALAAFLPVVHLVPLPVTAVASDRFLYLPLAGIAVAVAVGFPELRFRAVRWAAKLVALVAIVLLGSATIRRNRVWADEVTFWTAALDPMPAEPLRAWTEGAQVLFRERRFAESAMLRMRILQLQASRQALPLSVLRTQIT